jgi:RNA polymerase sigma factor (sigma-70 family)
MAARAVPLRHLHRLASGRPADSGDDAVLLGCFVRHGDEDAFTTLVARHGPMVLGVCRRVLADAHTAEDAFQAVFLVLARRAASVRPPEALAAWLHGVARRVALKARAAEARRSRREAPAADLAPPDPHPDPLAEVSARELLALLDDEVRRLPAAYRLPVLLCCLEGHSQEEAARRLGWTPGSLKGRVERGRARLHARLVRRGLTLSAVLGATEVARGTTSSLPALLAATTARAATRFAAGRGASGGASARVLALAEAMVRPPALLKGKVAAVLLVACAALAGAGVLAHQGAGKRSETAAREPDVPPQGQTPNADRYGDRLPPGAVARLGTTRLRTTASNLAFAADGRTVLTVAGGRTLGRWDPATGRLREETHLPGPFQDGGWFSPDGRLLAVPEDGGLGVWDTATGQRRRLLPHGAEHVAFTADGRTLAAADYVQSVGRIRLWDLATGKERVLAELPSYANDLAFDPEGKRLFAVIDNHSLRCWDASTGRQVWINDHWASNLAVSPGGRTLCSDTYQRGPLHLWDAATGRRLATLGTEQRWTAGLAFAPDGRSLAQGSPEGVFLWDVESRKLRHRFDLPNARVVFAPDGRSLVALGDLLQAWDTASGKALYPDTRARGHVGPVLAIAFAPDGRAVATFGADTTLRLWNRADGRHEVLRTDAPGYRGPIPSGNVFVAPTILEFAPDGRHLLTDVPPGQLVLTETVTGKQVRSFHLPRPESGSTLTAAARLTADGRTLLAVGQTMMMRNYLVLEQEEPLRGWDVATGREVLGRQVTCCGMAGAAFSPDGHLVIIPGACKLRDVRRGEERSLQGGPGGLRPPFVFSADGRLLAAVEPGPDVSTARSAQVYEVLTGKLLARLAAPLGYNLPVAFSADGRFVAAGGLDALHVWECSTGRRVLHLPARGRLTGWTPTGFALCLAFAPDGETLATGHADGTVLLWDLAPTLARLGPRPGPVDPEACWQALVGDARAAYGAIDRLAAAPE